MLWSDRFAVAIPKIPTAGLCFQGQARQALLKSESCDDAFE